VYYLRRKNIVAHQATVMKYLAFIPARAGSKGIPGKNMVLLEGKPLITYTFEAAAASQLISEVHLSTDDERIIALGEQYGVKSFYRRPEAISGDTASIYNVLEHHVGYLSKNNMEIPEVIVLLQPTSPLRSAGLIDRCIEAFEKSGADSLVAVSTVRQHPYEMFRQENGRNVFISNEANQRQSYPEYYFITGSIYIAKLSLLKKENKFFNESSAVYVVTAPEAVDIDVPDDLLLAGYYLTKINQL
jgi:CMP-N,N'-diacetyllegionaminic acid synthase